MKSKEQLAMEDTIRTTNQDGKSFIDIHKAKTLTKAFKLEQKKKQLAGKGKKGKRDDGSLSKESEKEKE